MTFYVFRGSHGLAEKYSTFQILCAFGPMDELIREWGCIEV